MTERGVPRLAADAPGYGRGFSSVIDPAKGARGVVIKLSLEHRVTVRVETPRGERLAGVPVQLYAMQRPAAVLFGERRARTNANGEHCFTGLSAGRLHASTPVAKQARKESQRIRVGGRTPTGVVTLHVTRRQLAAWEAERTDLESLKKRLPDGRAIDTDWETPQRSWGDEWDKIIRRRFRRVYDEARERGSSRKP